MAKYGEPSLNFAPNNRSKSIIRNTRNKSQLLTYDERRPKSILMPSESDISLVGNKYNMANQRSLVHEVSDFRQKVMPKQLLVSSFRNNDLGYVHDFHFKEDILSLARRKQSVPSMRQDEEMLSNMVYQAEQTLGDDLKLPQIYQGVTPKKVNVQIETIPLSQGLSRDHSTPNAHQFPKSRVSVLENHNPFQNKIRTPISYRIAQGAKKTIDQSQVSENDES